MQERLLLKGNAKPSITAHKYKIGLWVLEFCGGEQKKETNIRDYRQIGPAIDPLDKLRVPKMLLNWRSLYVITRIMSKVSVMIASPATPRRARNVNVASLKPFTSQTSKYSRQSRDPTTIDEEDELRWDDDYDIPWCPQEKSRILNLRPVILSPVRKS